VEERLRRLLIGRGDSLEAAEPLAISARYRPARGEYQENRRVHSQPITPDRCHAMQQLFRF
jgi:hypothetical protein